MKMSQPFSLLIAVAALAIGPGLVQSSGSAHEQGSEPAKPAAGLSITGDIARPVTWTLAELKAMPRTSVTVQESGQPAVYEGVLVGELLRRAGVSVGLRLPRQRPRYVRPGDRHRWIRSGVLDGELDPALSSDEIIVADTVGGKPLFDYQGPLRIIVPHDKRAARFVRMLVGLEMVRLRK